MFLLILVDLKMVDVKMVVEKIFDFHFFPFLLKSFCDVYRIKNVDLESIDLMSLLSEGQL